MAVRCSCGGVESGLQVREKVDAGALTLDKFVIHKQLTKRPEDYPDAKNQPHVQVALRRAAAHKRDGTKQVIPVLCLPASLKCTFSTGYQTHC